jgi:hypothetical protein
MTKLEIYEMYEYDYGNWCIEFRKESFKKDIIEKFYKIHNLMERRYNENRLLLKYYDRMTDTLMNIMEVLLEMELIDDNELEELQDVFYSVDFDIFQMI